MADTTTNPLEPAVEGEPTYFPSKPAKEESPFLKPGQVIAPLGEPAPTPYVDEGAIEKGKSTEQLLADAKKREQSKILQPPGDQWVYNGVTEQVEKAQPEEPPKKPPPPPPPTEPYEKEYKPEERLPQPPHWNEITSSPDWQKLDSDTKLKVLDRYTSDLKTMGHAEAERTQQDPKAYEAEADDFNKTERAKLESPLSILQNTGKEFDRGAIHKTAQLGVGLARGAKNVLYPELDLSDIGHMTVDQAKNELGELTKVNQPRYDELATQAREFLDKSSHFPGYFVNHPDEYFQGGKVGSMRFVPGPNGAIDVIQQAEANRRRIDALNTYVNSNGTEAPKQTAGEEFMQITGKLPEQASDAIKIDEVYKRNHPVVGRVAETIGAITPYVLSNLLTGGMGTVPAGLIPEAMGLSDAFQTQYEGAQAKLDEREAHGEHFTPYERERLALDDATRTSTGMGSFFALANMSLGGMMENVQTIPWLKTDLGETVTQNWLKYLLTGGIDVVAQGQIQAGASVIGNIGDRATGVDPRRKWYEGIGEAELTGMGFGLFGTGYRVGHALVESKKIGQLAQDATRQADDLLNSTAGTGITRNQALELTIAGATAQEPHYRDAVRARINLDAAGADEKKTAADIQDIAPETSKALDKDGDNTAGTSVTPVTKAQDQLQELRDRIKKKKEEREAAVNAAGAAGQAVAKGAVTAAPETTQETRAAEAEKATSGPRELSSEEKADREKRRKGINDQLDDYLGLDATDEDRKALVKDYLERNLYQNGTESTSEQRRSAAQLMHELGLDTREKLPDSWKTNTHESVAGMEQNFSDWLAGRIKERRETTETKVIPPETLAKGVETNDPTELRALLGQGKTMPLTDDEVEKYDDFFLRHNFDVNYDKNEKPYLALRPETEETLLPETAEPKVEKKKAERMDVALRQNSPEFAQGIDELEPHPYEKEHLEQAYRIAKGAGAARIDRELKASEKPDAEDVQAAAIFSYLQHLRRYAKRKRELGQEDQLVAPGEQLPAVSETTPEGEAAEPEEEAAPAEKKEAAAPINKLPNIWQHINWVLKQYGSKRRAGKTIDPEEVVRLNKAPLGLSEGSTLENVVAAQLEKNKAGITREEEAKERLEEEGVAAEEKAAPAEEGKGFRWSTLGSDDIVRLAKEFIPTLPEKDQRIGWYFLRHYNYITPDEVPEGVKGATNISRRELTRVARQIGDYIQRNYQSGPPPEAGKPEGPPGPGGGGHPPPPGGGAVPAPPHPQPVLPGTELSGHPAGGPPPETGGREPAVRKEGEAALGQPQRVLPVERGGPEPGAAERVTPPGGTAAQAERGAPAAGERGGGAQRPGGATGASRERTIHVQERPGHERGGPNPTGSGNLPGGGSIAGTGVSAGGRGVGVEATTGLETVGKIGGAISQNMRDMLWDKFQRGSTTEAGGPSNLLLLAAREKAAGRITSREDFEAFVTRYGDSLQAKQPIGEFAKAEAGRQAVTAETTPLEIAKALMKRPEIAEDHGINVGDFDNAQALADHLGELEDNHEDPEAWYKEMAGDLGLKPAKAAASAAAPPAVAKAEVPVAAPVAALAAPTVEQVSRETGIEPEIIEELVHRERIQATQGLNRPVKPKLENIRLLLDRSEPNIPLALNVIKDLQGTIGTAKVPESSSKLDYVKAQGDQAFKNRKGDLITNLGEIRTALEAGDTAKALEFVKNLEEKPPTVAAEGTRKLETILKTGAPPPEPAAAPGIIAREDVSSNKDALNYLKQIRQLDTDQSHVEEWPDKMRADYISKMGLTPEPAVGGVLDKTAEVNAIRKSLQERSENTLNRMAKVLGRTSEEVNHFVRTLGEEELKPTKPKPKAPAAPVVDPVVQASDPVRIAEATTPPLATKINDYLKANPDTATHWGINPGDDILARYRQLRPKATPEEESNFVQAMAQRLGLVDPPHDTDTAKRAGKMHSMKPGVAKAHAALSGDAQDLVNHLRASTNPEEQAFARSLNAHARTLRGVYIYTADHPDPVVYMEGKNLWASPSVVDHPLGHLAAAQELQHVIAHKKLKMPQTSDEFESVAHWEYLRSRVESHLPAELRGELHTTFSDLFNKFDATGYLDNRALTPAEERYLPFMYAAQRGENLLNSVFNSRAYRDYLKALKEPDGRSVWDGIENWGKRIFGDQAFKYLNDVEPLTGNTPGIKYRGPMPDLTIAEQRAKRLFNKYRLNENNAQAALESVVKHTENSRLKHVAEAMVNVAKQYPEITVGLQNRLGGDAGGYIFFGDHVMVNPNYSDGQIQHTIVHEMVHAFVNGKIKAFLNGQVHLVTAQDAAAITRLLDLRNYALKHPSIPKEMQQVAGHKTYGDRIDAYMDWAQKNPHAGDTYYGLTDLTEFATEALSNGKFQELLDKIPYTLKEAYGPTKPRTVLQKAFQFIRNLLGFKEDTVLSRAFEDVSKLMGGRRVMEADYNVGFLHGTKTLKAQENLMAKRELDRRAKEGGFDSTRDVPIDRLNQWVQEWRQGQGVASGVVDPTKTYTKTSRTDTRAQIQGSDKLSAMTRPADIIDHLANVTGTRHDDIESLNDMVRQAFKNKAINLDQFSKSMQALDQGSNEVYHRLHLDMGDEKDNHSAISRWTRFHHQWRPEGNLPKEAYEAMQKQVYESQATAFEIQNRWKDLRSAMAKEWKISPSDVVKHNDIREALNNMLEGKPAGRTMPRSVIEATDAMRAAVERRSLNILDEDMVSGDKWAKIEENLGTYMARSYRLFDDPRFLSRPESQKYRNAAEKEVDTMLRGASRAKEARRIAENAREDAKRNFATGSTAGEDAGQKAYDAAYTDALANVGKHALDRMLANWQQRSENRETKMLQFGHAFGINDKLMARLTEMPENVRKLIGEERDPFARFANTIWRQQNFINTVRLSRDLARLGEEGGYITKRLTDTNNRQIPKGFSHLGELAGRYTTPEIAGALTKFQENIEALPSSNPALNVIRQFESTARYTTTILSTMRSMANFHGMIFSHLNNGYWNPVPAWKPLRELLANKLAGMNNPQREEYLMDLYRRGLSDKESDINYMMDFLKSGPHITARTSQDLLEAFTDWWKKAGQATQKPRDWALNLHTVGNFISKASQYEQQIGRERAFNNWDVKYRGAERLNDEQLRDRAAQVVRETNISYSRASPFIREARKFPVIGTFLTYWEQSFRSYFGSAMHMYKNLLSDNPIRKWDGVARLAGMLTSTLLPAGLQALSQHMFGVSDAEDKHFRSLLPPWEQNQALFYGPMTDKGKRAYWNASYSTQQSDISRSIHALLNFRNNPDGVPGAIRDSIFESGRSFVNLGLVPGALVDLQRNQTEYGTQVYNPQDTWQNITGDVTRHVMQRVAGGTIGRFGNKILPPLLHGGEYVSQSGAVYNWWSGLLPEVSGLNIKEISFPDRFRSEMYTTKANFKNAERLFTGPIMRSGNQMTDADMEEAYNRSEQARRKVFNDLRSKIEAARFGGMTTQQIRGTLHLRQFSHQMIDDLLSNRYHPYVPSKTIVGNAKANGNRLPARLFSRRAVFLEPEEGEEE
jgi:hypothetical protein